MTITIQESKPFQRSTLTKVYPMRAFCVPENMTTPQHTSQLETLSHMFICNNIYTTVFHLF